MWLIAKIRNGREIINSTLSSGVCTWNAAFDVARIRQTSLPPAREREIRLPFTREIESTRPGFFVKLKIYANQRRSIERAARCTTRARATLPLPERGEECFPTAGNLISATLRGPEIRRRVVLFPSRVTDSIVNSHDLKKACRVFPSPSSPLFHPFTGCERNVFLFFFDLESAANTIRILLNSDRLLICEKFKKSLQFSKLTWMLTKMSALSTIFNLLCPFINVISFVIIHLGNKIGPQKKGTIIRWFNRQIIFEFVSSNHYIISLLGYYT